MKRTITIFILCFAFLCLLKAQSYSRYNTLPYLFPDKTSIILSADGNCRHDTLHIHSNIDWVLSDLSDDTQWLEINPRMGKAGVTQVIVSAKEDKELTSDNFSIINILERQKEYAYVMSAALHLNQFPADDNLFYRIEDPVFRYYCKRFDTDRDGILSISEARKVEDIDVKGMYIYSLDALELFPNLRRLVCDSTNIEGLMLYNNNKLEYLSCSNCYLPRLSVLDNPFIEEINCSASHIGDLLLSQSNSRLKKLICHSNKLRELQLTSESNLEYLDCHDNHLVYLDLWSNKRLKWADCSMEGLQNILIADHFGRDNTYHLETDSASRILQRKPLRKEILPEYDQVRKAYFKALKLIDKHIDKAGNPRLNDEQSARLMKDLLKLSKKKVIDFDSKSLDKEFYIQILALASAFPDPQVVNDIRKEEVAEIVKRIRYFGISLQQQDLFDSLFNQFPQAPRSYFDRFLQMNFKTYDHNDLYDMDNGKSDDEMVELIWNDGNFR